MFNFNDIFQKIFLFISLIYAFIPFEASFRVDRFHAFWLILIMIYAFYMNAFKTNKYTIIYIFFFLLVALLNSLVSIGNDIVIFFTSLLFSAVIVPVIYSNERFRIQFTAAIKWLIMFSIVTFFIQFIVLVINGNLLLMHELVFPFSHARIAHESTYGNLTRMGGMYIEPGTYANFMFVYLFIYIVLTRNYKNILLFIAAFSIILTFSVWGLIFSTYLIMMLILANLYNVSLRNKFILVVIISITGYYIFGYVNNSPIVEYAINKTQSGNKRSSGSTAAKKYVYKKYSEQYDHFLILGQGFKPEFKNGTDSMQDSGVLLNMSIVFGLLFTIFFSISFIYALWRITNVWIVLGALPIFISKLYYWDPALYLLYFLVVYGAFFNYKKESNENTLSR